jgi:ABC-type glycerol-3-phosphate transport system substrate-binding protein
MSRTSSRRAFLTGSVGLGALGVLAACQQAAPPTPVERVVEKVVTQVVEKEKIVERQVTVVAAAPAKPKQQGQLVFWGHGNHPVPNAFPGFEERNPGIKMKYEELGDWLVKFRTTLASGTDVPDLVWLEETTIQELGSKGVLLETTEIVAPKKEQLSKGKLAAALIAKTGKYYSVPGDIGLVGLWYREDLLAKAGIKELPQGLKFDDWLKMATQVKKETDAAAFVLPKAGYNRLFQILLSQNGGSYTTPDGTKVTLDDEKGLAAMTQIKQIWDSGSVLDAARPAPTYWAAVKGGKLGADYLPAWERGFFEGDVKSPAEGAGQWRVAPLPTVPNGVSRTAQVGGAMLTSTKFTKLPEAVLAFQDYAFMTMDGATAVGSWGIIPSYLPYLDSPMFQSLSSPIFGQFKFTKVWAELAKELSSVYVRTAVFAEANTVIGDDMMPMMLGQVPIPEGMKKLGEKVRQLNQRYQ